MHVLGVDPGLLRCGIAVLWRGKPSEPWYCRSAVTIRTDAKHSMHVRLGDIWRAMRAGMHPTLFGTGVLIVCEEQSGAAEGHRLRGTTNARAVLVQQVVGLVHAFALDRGFFVDVTPTEAKRVLPGISQTASKAQVQRAVRAIVKDCPTRMSEHASDAVAIALAGARKWRP